MRPSNRTTAAPTDRATRRRAVLVAVAVAAYGLSFGVVAVAAGLSPGLATAASVLILAGGSQFAFVGVLAAGGAPMTGAVAGLLLNLRYVPFGVAIGPHLPPGGVGRRAVDSYLVVDESVALGLGGDRSSVAARFRLTGWAVVVAWIGATALGAFGGRLLADPGVLGLDAAFPAGFLALLAPWLRTRTGRVAAATGVALALTLTPVAPPGVPIVAAALGAAVALRVAAPSPTGVPGSADEPSTTTAEAASEPSRRGGADEPAVDRHAAQRPTAETTQVRP